jgi:hypothetical protein
VVQAAQKRAGLIVKYDKNGTTKPLLQLQADTATINKPKDEEVSAAH